MRSFLFLCCLRPVVAVAILWHAVSVAVLCHFVAVVPSVESVFDFSVVDSCCK